MLGALRAAERGRVGVYDNRDGGWVDRGGLASGSISGDRMEGRGGNGTYGKRLRDTRIDAGSSVVRLCAKNEIRLSALLPLGKYSPPPPFALSSTAGKLANWERRRVKHR
jgi:hypothetical protein